MPPTRTGQFFVGISDDHAQSSSFRQKRPMDASPRSSQAVGVCVFPRPKRVRPADVCVQISWRASCHSPCGAEPVLPVVMSSGAKRSRDICPRPQDASDSQADPSTALGVTEKTYPATKSSQTPADVPRSSSARAREIKGIRALWGPSGLAGHASARSLPI